MRPPSLLPLCLIALFLARADFAVAANPFDFGSGTAKSVKNSPVMVEADRLDYDQNLGVMTARGKVQIVQDERFVLADQLSYNERDDVLTVSGNIVVRDQNGDTAYADFAELRDDMKSGVVRNLRLRLNDNSRLAATEAKRVDGQYNSMRNAVFSPCLPCAEHPERAPLWQIKARTVNHDVQKREMQYEDARLEFWGTPLFYSPYLSHPDPTLKRKTGLLSPLISNSSELGLIYRQAYYIDVSPYQDLWLQPMLMSKDGVILYDQYRQRLSSGSLDFKSSLGYVDSRDGDDKTVRGHINSRLNLDLDDNWRANVDIDRASDKTYLRRYRFSGDDVLTSQAKAEGFFGRDYVMARSMSFQGLRDFDKSRTTPVILPQVGYSLNTERDNLGGFWNVNTDLLNLQRVTGTDSRRAVIDAQWQRPFRTDSGQLIDFKLHSVAAGYNVNDYDDPLTPSIDDESGWRGRALPQAALNWRYPLAGRWQVDQGRSWTRYIEPVVEAVGAPNIGQSRLIPNEDSQAFEFDESNLFSLKRFPGYDRLAGGSRVDYGVNLGLFDDNSKGGKIFVGQSWRPREDSTYAVGSGLENHFSDVVGKVEINPSEMVDLIYRFRLDTDEPAIRRSEFSIITQTGPLKLGLDYMFLDRLAGSGEFNNREQAGLRASYQMTQNWNLSGHVLTDVNSSHATQEFATGVTYHDECISMGLSLERDFTRDSENKPGTSLIFRIDLKDLGGEIQNDYFTPKRGNVYTGTLLPQQ